MENLDENIFRYERKFVVPILDKSEAEALIKANSFLFEEIFHERQVNNIYLDTVDMTSYFDNVLGNADRMKMRIRWYGDFDKVEKPALEVKIRKGLVGTKFRFPLERFFLPCSLDDMKMVFERSKLPLWVLDTLKAQRFALVNHYKRKYFLSDCKRFRVTVDSDMTYQGILNQNFSLLNEIKDDHHILELKYDVDKLGEGVSSQFPFRMTKSSKYVSGVTYFRGE